MPDVPLTDVDRTTIDGFAELFVGRTDVRGLEHGECRRGAVTPFHYECHLTRPGQSLGVYPLVERDGEWMVHWGATDIDVGYDVGWPMALNLARTLELLHISGWVERTKSKGFHVWVFASEWVPAETMRRALLVAHQVAGVPPTEVNPKQTSGASTKQGLGNYVNLPYAHDWVGLDKRVIMGVAEYPLNAWALESFVQRALEARTSTATLERAAALWTPPPPPPKVDVGEYDGELEPLVARMGGLAWTIFTGGPLEGRDRSSTLARLAHLIAEGAAHTPSEALALMVNADLRFGKFYERPDGEYQLQRMVESAFAKHAAST